MSYDSRFLESLRDAVPLAGVIGRKVRLTKRGREFVGLCPFHNEKSPSFTVNEDKGFFHCFGCGAHGDVIGFVMQTEGLSFPEAVEKLAGEANLPLPRRSEAERQAARQRGDLQAVVDLACAWFEAQLAQPAGEAARAYLARRGLEPATVARFRLGYAPGQRGLLQKAMNAKGVDDRQLVAAGLLKRPDDGGPLRDYFFDRIVFPITDRRGRAIAFGGRAMAAEAKAKYLNSPDGELFHKGSVLYNLHHARQAAHDTGEVIVAEGYMDVIAMSQAGFHAVVAPLGTAVTEAQLQLLWRLAPEPVLCLDGDSAGQRAALRAAERALPLLQPGRSLRFAMLPAGEDPDSLLQGQGAPALRSVLQGARPLAEALWAGKLAGRALDTPERRAALRAELMQAVDQIRERGVQEAYRSEMLARYDALFRRPGRGRPPGGGGAAAPWRGGAGDGGGLGGAMGAARPLAAPLSRPSPELLRRRPEQVLLAMSVNHPALAGDRLEELAGLALSPELDRLREALVDLLSQGADLDTSDVKCHLSDQGFERVLNRLLSPEVYLHEPLARPEATAAEVRKRLGYWVKRVREGDGREAVGEAVRRLAEDTSEAELDRVRAERDLAEESTAHQQMIESYEAAEPQE